MLEITPAAIDAIKDIIGPDAAAGTGFRISVEGEGGDEADVALDVEEAPFEGDIIIDAGSGVFIYLDEDAAERFEESVLGVEPHGDHVHFELGQQNPE